MQVKLQLVLMTYLVLHLGLTCIATHKSFLVPCQNQTFHKPINAINCTMFLVDNATKMQLKKLISNPNVKIILLNIIRSEKTRNNLLNIPPRLGHSNIYFYKQFRWQMVRLDVGQNLLLLFLKFRLINLTIIDIGVRTRDIHLRSEPSGCLTNISDSNFGYLIREMLLDYTVDSASQGKDTLSVCNQVITESRGIANFQTMCYTHKLKHQMSCDFLKPSHEWEYLIIFRDLVAVVTLLFVPFLIPTRLYTLKRSKYLFYLPEKLPVTLQITKKRLSNVAESQNYVIPIEQYPSLKNICQDSEKEYNGTLKALYFDVDERQIIPRGNAGAEFSRLLYNKLFRCKYYSNQMQTCLTGRLFPFFCQCYRDLTWYRCCRWFMNLVLILLLPLPWLLRLFIYYRYEQKDITDRANAVKSLNLKLPLRGTILNYIPPLHWTFLFVYSLYFLDLLFFGILDLSRRNKLAEIIKEAFRGMREYAKLENVTFHAELLLQPLKTFGLAGLVLAPFFWIVAIPALLILHSFHLIPMFRLVLCLLSNIAAYCSPCLLNKLVLVNVKHLPCQQRFINFITTLLFLVSLVSAGILIAECICYLVTVVFYAFIILILKANQTLPYLSLGFLVIFYFFENVNAVRTEYDNFQKEITDKLIEEIGDINKDRSNLSYSRLVNTAYGTNDSFVGFNEWRGTGLIFNSVSLLLFIDSRNRTHIPERFFYKICHLPYDDCPGSLTISYLQALRKYLVILGFLSFVFMVVRTFFGLYNVSSTNQMLATLAGGFLPLFIQKLINMNAQIPEVDMETISCKTHFTKTVKEYSEDWVVSDFVIDLQENDTSNGPISSSANCVINPNFFVNFKLRSAKSEPQETIV